MADYPIVGRGNGDGGQKKREVCDALEHLRVIMGEKVRSSLFWKKRMRSSAWRRAVWSMDKVFASSRRISGGTSIFSDTALSRGGDGLGSSVMLIRSPPIRVSHVIPKVSNTTAVFARNNSQWNLLAIISQK